MSEPHIRPLVAKLLPLFQGYLKQFGPDTVKKVLRDGNCGKFRLTVMKNRRDRFQMMQALGLIADRSEVPRG